MMRSFNAIAAIECVRRHLTLMVLSDDSDRTSGSIYCLRSS